MFDHPTGTGRANEGGAGFSFLLAAWPERPTRQQRQHAADALQIESLVFDQATDATDPMHVAGVEQALAAAGFLRDEKPFALVHANGLDCDVEFFGHFADFAPSFLLRVCHCDACEKPYQEKLYFEIQYSQMPSHEMFLLQLFDYYEFSWRCEGHFELSIFSTLKNFDFDS